MGTEMRFAAAAIAAASSSAPPESRMPSVSESTPDAAPAQPQTSMTMMRTINRPFATPKRNSTGMETATMISPAHRIASTACGAAAAVKNMIANLTGMICDGAKPSCAMKLTSGVSTAVLSAMMAMDGHCVTPVEGIIEEDVDKCIRNLTAIGRDGMNETDSLVLRIMTNKC